MSVNLSELLELPLEERLKLVESIWDSIAEFPEALELTDAQKKELDRRLEAYESDPNAGIPWSELKAQLLAIPRLVSPKCGT
jgi:putative addiction module component (TIGR02574 family)